MNSTPLLADSWSEGNYPPDDKSIVIGETNLPIVFIDTRNGSTVVEAELRGGKVVNVSVSPQHRRKDIVW